MMAAALREKEGEGDKEGLSGAGTFPFSDHHLYLTSPYITDRLPIYFGYATDRIMGRADFGPGVQEEKKGKKFVSILIRCLSRATGKEMGRETRSGSQIQPMVT
jgi:hypothetical protein